jgi:hypothetical protein
MTSRMLVPGGVAIAMLLCAALPCAALATTTPAVRGTAPAPAADVTGTVTDSASGAPIASAQVSITQSGKIILNTGTDAFGRFTAHNLPAGAYDVGVHFIGFAAQTRHVTVSASSATVRLDFKLLAVATSLAAVEVKAEAPVEIDLRSATQTFKQEEFHDAPTVTPSQILQQSIVGAARAPTGEVHIRGQHGEYSYFIDGVPVPAGISGSLNELFDPQVVNSMNFQTGGWDAEFGNKNAAIINVVTKIPAGDFHMTATGSAGSFATSTQGLSMSGNSNGIGLFVSGGRQITAMRREPVMFDSTTNTPVNFHNNGEDDFGFAKLQFAPGLADLFSIDASLGRTFFAVPYDSSGGTTLDDHQTDHNAFVNFGWRHLFGDPKASTEDSPAELFTGLFYRTGSLRYTPGLTDTPSFFFFPDTINGYNVQEDRSFTTTGAKIDLTLRPGHEVTFKTGIQALNTTGHEDFSTVDAAGKPGPQSNSGLTGGDIGGYAETMYAPVEEFELRTGARYDAHTAPFAGTQTQFSPRIRLNFFPDPSWTIYVYYGRMFIPTNVEDLRSITSVAQGTATVPTLPERDNFYEAGIVHRYDFAGMVTKAAFYHKDSSPGIDDNTVPGSAIVTDVNIANVHIVGMEAVVEFHPDGPLSGSVNGALNHADGIGPVTGGFFPAQLPTGYFDLDHDQRLSVVGNAQYSQDRFFVSSTVIYGSGLTNGVNPSTCGCQYGTGVFDFNKAIKVAPSTVVNASVGYEWKLGDQVLRPQVYVDNLLDNHYILKGAFFSGLSAGRPRSIQFRMAIGV